MIPIFHLLSILTKPLHFRMIPRLPPKQLMLDSLLEERRKGLHRWLRIVSRHPIVGNDPLLVQFLTDRSEGHQEHLREVFSRELDEFSKLSENVELPLEDQGRLAASRETMRTMLNSVTKLKRLADQQSQRLHSQAKDIEEMGSVLKLIGSSHKQVFSGSTFDEMASGFKEVSNLSEQCAQQQHNSICERFNMLIDVLQAHR